MTRPTLNQRLASAPPKVRRSMLAHADTLEPGAAAVTGRFFGIVETRREPIMAPSAQSF